MQNIRQKKKKRIKKNFFGFKVRKQDELDPCFILLGLYAYCRMPNI